MPQRPNVISDAYRSIQQELHEDPGYGVASRTYAPLVRDVLAEFGGRSVSDYGAGKQNLNRALQALGVAVDYRPYDPAFPEYGLPKPADLVCCIDVLEHVEPELLDNVLDELQGLVTGHGLMTVHTGPASKLLADGRNAHLIQQPRDWWLQRLASRFGVVRVTEAPGGFVVLVRPRADGVRPESTGEAAVPAPVTPPLRIPGQMDLTALLLALARYLAATPMAERGLKLTDRAAVEGWLNVGAQADPAPQMIHNLAHGLSFMPAACMARAYLDAPLHQMAPGAALALLKDTNTALVPEGFLRVALPDASARPPGVASGYDVETAKALLEAAGFIDVTRRAYESSDVPGLAGLDRCVPEASLILEGRMPSRA